MGLCRSALAYGHHHTHALAMAPQAVLVSSNAAAAQRNARLKLQAKRLLEQLQQTDTGLGDAAGGFKVMGAGMAWAGRAQQQAR